MPGNLVRIPGNLVRIPGSTPNIENNQAQTNNPRLSIHLRNASAGARVRKVDDNIVQWRYNAGSQC
ncbi:hypothetical protein DPMN_146891 [Dreissena polymorpha]|uniref:Uncharacterized protein n=1 Tax=Dreissena polymorpha TaxID=45954 RepID=A0A9D4J2H9_DREPO|nr:hypothetical protein DPMN_146891 [Dreissena polymorpha]